MKKRFTILIAAIAAILMMAQPVKVKGQTKTEAVLYTLNPVAGSDNGYATAEDIDVEDEDTDITITWNVTGNSTMVPWRIGGKNLSGVDRNVYSKTEMESAITKVDLTVGTASSVTVNSLKLVVASDYKDFANTKIDEVSKTFKANSTITFMPTLPLTEWPTDSYYMFVFNVTIGKDNKYIQFTKAEFYGEPSVYTPSINANSVNIAANATSGSITYTIDNGVAGGAVTSATVTSSTPSGWLTVTGSNPYTSPIGLTCEANTGASAKTATVQLTYTYNTDQTVTKNVSVTQSAPTYNITYNANGASSGSVPTDATNYTSGTQARVKANTGNLAKTDYYWIGWNTATDGSGTPYTSYDKFNIAGNTTLYAQWASTYVTYTVSSTSSVSSSGTAPANSSASFSQTYGTECQMTSGNSMTLTLSGYKNQIIKGIVLSMKSNSGGGKGYMSAIVGSSNTIASFGSSGSGNDKTFNGDWYTGWSTSYVDIPITLSNSSYVIQQNENLVITINATANSLYCQSFTLYYETSADPIINADNVVLKYDDESGEIPYTIINPNGENLTAAKTSGDWISGVTVDGANSKVTFTTTANTGEGREGTITLSYTGASDKVIKVYQEAQKFTVTYAAGTGGSGTMTDSNSPYEYGAEVTLLDNTFTAPSGKMFNDWAVTDGSSNPVSVSDGKFTMPKSDVTVTAQWRDKLKYALVTNINQLIPGKHYIFVGKDGENYYAMGKDRGNNRLGIGVSVDGEGKIAETTGLYEFVISGSSADYWTIYDSNTLGLNEGTDKTGYLYAAGGTSNNYLKTQTSNDYKGQWSITIASETNLATIQANISTANARKYMQYNHNGGNPDLFSCYKDNDANVYIYVRDGDNDCEINSATTISSGTTTISGDMNIVSGIVTIQDGATLKVNGTLTNTTAANLIIEDGGQLILSDDASVQATVKNSTAASTETKTYDIQWNAISSPVDNVVVTSFVKGDTHNVYRYDEKTVYWQEYRGTNGFNNLQNGRGYIYRSTESGIEFQGEVITGTVSCADYLSYACDNNRYIGFNLIGNPFTHDITWSNLTTKTNISSAGFFLLGADGNWSAQTTSGTIAPMQAFLVQATEESPVINISNTAGKGDDRYGNDQIQFTVNNSEYSDVAYAIFREGHGLNKIEHRNDNIPMLYIINDDKDYAIAEMPDNTNVINLGFKARAIGQYTLSLNAEGRYSYMHLYDKLTGSDVDMLLDNSYTFVGSPSDRNDRFVLRLNYNAANIDTESDIFAYQNGADIIISGTGELQIFDIMGHQVSTQRINGVETINVSTQGVYILRLVGTEIKTQKIVVR